MLKSSRISFSILSGKAAFVQSRWQTYLQSADDCGHQIRYEFSSEFWSGQPSAGDRGIQNFGRKASMSNFSEIKGSESLASFSLRSQESAKKANGVKRGN